jgi:hypothetical protein
MLRARGCGSVQGSRGRFIDLSAHVEHHQDNHHGHGHGHGHGNNPVRFHPIIITSLLASCRAVRAGYVDVASIKEGGVSAISRARSELAMKPNLRQGGGNLPYGVDSKGSFWNDAMKTGILGKAPWFAAL